MHGIYIRCNQCKKWWHDEVHTQCTCGMNLKTQKEKKFRIDWIDPLGRRKRKHIPGFDNRNVAVYLISKIQKEIIEDRYIDRDPAGILTLGELFEWYKTLPEVKDKKGYKSNIASAQTIIDGLGPSIKIKQLTRGMVESYQAWKLQEPSPLIKGKNWSATTIRSQVCRLIAVINRAVAHGKLQFNPLNHVRLISPAEKKTKDLTPDQYQQIRDEATQPWRDMVTLSYYTGMRLGEVLRLKWGCVDLKKWVITLSGEMTKSGHGRLIPIHHSNLKEIFSRRVRGLPETVVFGNTKGRAYHPVTLFREMQRVSQATGIDFTFHSFRYSAINNFRRAGIDEYTRRAIVGHESKEVHWLYTNVTADDVSNIKWLEESDTLDDTQKISS